MESYLLFHGLKKIDDWVRPEGIKKIIAITTLIVICILCSLLVYFTGGIQFVFSHTIYIPIIISALIFGYKGAVLSSVFCGLLLGPFMPITIEPLVYQEPVNWLYRMGIFLINSLVFAFVFNSAYKIYKKMELSLLFDSDTSLPNTFSLKKRIAQEIQGDGNFYLANLMLGNYSSTVGALGFDKYTSFLIQYADYLKEKMSFIDEVYFLQNDHLAFIIKGDEDLQQMLGNISFFRKKVCRTDTLTSYPDAYIGIVEGKNGNNPQSYYRMVEMSYYLAFQACKSKSFYMKYNDGIDLEINRNHSFVTEFPLAVNNGNIILHYQPKIDLKTKKIVGAEALARWVHAEKGMIPPMAWIPAIENTGLIDMLTECVLEKTLEQMKKWQDEGVDINVSINVSTFNLTKEFAAHIISKLDEYRIPSSKLELEITETSLFNNLAEVIEIMHDLSRKGIMFSIDDFGTGFSSLSYLKNLPVNYLKIDQTFIRNLLTDKASQVITRSTVDLCSLLGINSVAEGIEDVESEKHLIDFGCTIGQGYYYSKPMPADEFPAFYNRFNQG